MTSAFETARIDTISLKRFEADDEWPAMITATISIAVTHSISSASAIDLGPEYREISIRLPAPTGGEETLAAAESRAAETLRDTLRFLAEAI